MTGAIDDVHRTIVDLDAGADKEKIAEGKVIISKLVELKHNLEHDKQLKPFVADYNKYGSDLKYFNEELDKNGPMTWLSAPWMFSECYMYRLLFTFMQDTVHWRQYDMFYRQKEATFKASSKAVSELAVRYKALAQQLSSSSADQEALAVLFREFVDISLWGNATDLSLLTNVSLESIQSLQGAEARKKNEKNVLVNDTDAAWEAIASQSGGRIDIVLDNSGFELYADLIFLLFLLDTKLCDTIVLHPKNMPWFVSDVLPGDILKVINNLQDPQFFPDHREDLDYLVDKIADYHSEGNIVIRTSPFWTTHSPYWEIDSDGKNGGDLVWQDLKDSKLVIFKGDLNHRKMLGDAQWPKDTPFLHAIGPLASSGVRVLTLRTCKADVCTGISKEQEQELEKEWLAQGNKSKEGWVHYGKYAVIQFSEGDYEDCGN